MTVPYVLREHAAEFDRTAERLTGEIEDAEKRIVDLRRRRDEARLHRAEALAAAQFLEHAGFRVERDAAGVVTVSIDQPPSVAS